MSFFSDLSRRHEALKKRIHSFRLPLGPVGRTIMGFIYFSIPVAGGLWVMEIAKGEASKNLEGGAVLRKKVRRVFCCYFDIIFVVIDVITTSYL